MTIAELAASNLAAQRSIEAGQEALRLLRDLYDWTADGPVSLSEEDRAKIRTLLEAAK